MDKSSSIKIIGIILVVIVNIIALTSAFSSIYTTAKKVISAEKIEDEFDDFGQDGTIISSSTTENSGELNLMGVLGEYFKTNGISTIVYAAEILVGVNLIIIAIILMMKIRKI